MKIIYIPILILLFFIAVIIYALNQGFQISWLAVALSVLIGGGFIYWLSKEK